MIKVDYPDTKREAGSLVLLARGRAMQVGEGGKLMPRTLPAGKRFS